jgi:putative pyruvate formate lyase activating enzyme
MPDFKLWDAGAAARLLQAPDYPVVARAALTEMHRQVGLLELDDEGLAFRGLLVRHLVLPGGLAGTAAVARCVAALDPATYFNLMDQYRPCHRAHEIPGLERILSPAEWRAAVAAVAAAGLTRLDGGADLAPV